MVSYDTSHKGAKPNTGKSGIGRVIHNSAGKVGGDRRTDSSTID